MIRKIRLESVNLRYGPAPEPEEEVMQRLTLASDGRAWLSRYAYGTGAYVLIRQEKLKIHSAQTRKILEAAEKCFRECEPVWVTDVGSWTLEMTGEDGTVRKVDGYLARDEQIEAYHLSGWIREALGKPDLFAFDGRTGSGEGELVFCDVSFTDGGKTYCYLADEDEYDEGDLVDVPVGDDGEERVGCIEQIQFLPPEDAPYPLERIKHIIGKHGQGKDGDRGKTGGTLIEELERIAYDPYERIEHPTAEDWKKSYDALKQLCELCPDSGLYQNTLGYLCYYGRHTGGERQYEEARMWFEQGAERRVIESQYKLADMLTEGLGGEKDPERALKLYQNMYWYCREQFEAGVRESKFADTALRMGRVYHEGKLVEKDDLEALGYLLEAKYAVEWRKQFDQYGDDTVERNILRLIDECEKLGTDATQFPLVEMGPGRVPYFLLNFADGLMTMDIAANDDGLLRLEFRRKRKDGKKPSRILWSAAPVMKCFMTDFVVLYAAEVRMVWNIKPGEQVVCDRYEYDREKDLNLFYLGDELQCKLMGGIYALAMNEFVLTEMRDHPEYGSDISQ